MSRDKVRRGTRPRWASTPHHQPVDEFEEHWQHTGCADKRQYPTKRKAKLYARHHKLKQRAYRCRFCGGFHLATKRPLR